MALGPGRTAWRNMISQLFPNSPGWSLLSGTSAAGTKSQPVPSASVQSLFGDASDTEIKTASELEEVKRRKKLFGDSATPLGSAAVMSLTGNQF